ncbi:unnamed protein product, partial [marine sediment metagenome]
MESNNKQNETEKLTQILSIVQNLYYKKKEQLDDLKLEISELQSVLSNINSLVSNQSFSSADELFSKLQTPEKKPIDEFFNE